ncbi:hypothetical protein [Clostridium cellulovorans]|uniref:DUF4878 domain-containing protein n=1 Tax=Clostridium cellulovorans (strain ATCC 35296 / DSM 3052 / OCM 3 / 743B) TaxID=573061 RepID=D9SSV1_CLOC7|nr:hypothetical protein [Clostridium cellulovorans]ADL52613.1 hypothetical protein Clocel_2919 [Clostridium cellulovorans 743B]
MKKNKINPKYKILLTKALIPLILITSIKAVFFREPEQQVDIFVKTYMTSSIFNKYKIKDISNLEVIFSDGNYAVVNIQGRDNRSNEIVRYDIYVTKDERHWKIKKITEKDVLSNKVKKYLN